LGAALSAVAEHLPQLGLTWLHSCFVHLYLANMSHFGAANEAYCRHLPQVDPPSRACVQVRLGWGCCVFAKQAKQCQQHVRYEGCTHGPWEVA
jgi:hypothetical protein